MELHNRPGVDKHINPNEPAKEKIPHARDVVIATNFLYQGYTHLPEGQARNPGDTVGIRGDLALEFLHNAADAGVRVVAADGGSSEVFIEALKQFDNVKVVTTDIPGRAPQRRAAFAEAISLAGSKVVIYSQPEKVGLIDSLAAISQPIINGEADIVIPERERALFEQTYPEYMRQSEERVNTTYDRVLQRAGLMQPDQHFDWFFGPAAFKNDPEIANLFLKKYEVSEAIKSRIGAVVNPEMHSGSHYFPIIEALFAGKRVASVEAPFAYPQDQKENELSEEARAAFVERRLKDASAYRLEMLHFLALLKGDKRSKVKEMPSVERARATLRTIYKASEERGISTITSGEAVDNLYLTGEKEDERYITTTVGLIHGPAEEFLRRLQSQIQDVEPDIQLVPGNFLHVTLRDFTFDDRGRRQSGVNAEAMRKYHEILRSRLAQPGRPISLELFRIFPTINRIPENSVALVAAFLPKDQRIFEVREQIHDDIHIQSERPGGTTGVIFATLGRFPHAPRENGKPLYDMLAQINAQIQSRYEAEISEIDLVSTAPGRATDLDRSVFLIPSIPLVDGVQSQPQETHFVRAQHRLVLDNIKEI